jgi:predicted nuclease of predicted toxin-antitoxin system
MKINKQYKIILHSLDAVFSNGVFIFKVNIPDYELKPNYMLACESFYTTYDLTDDNFAGDFFNIHIRNLNQLYTYDSKTQSTTDIIITHDTDFTDTSFTRQSKGLILTDSSFILNKQLQIYFTNSKREIITTMNNNNSNFFQITLVIIESENNETIK